MQLAQWHWNVIDTTLGVINGDKNLYYIGTVRDPKRDNFLPKKCKRLPSQYMINMVEQDHCFIKRKVKPGLAFFSFPTAW